MSVSALHELVLEQARARPDAVAVTVGGDSITYGHLVARAAELARKLRARGAAPDTYVGVTVDRSTEAVVGLLGALMSGAAKVPLAADLPPTRLRSLIADAGIRLMTGVAGESPVEFVPVPGDARNAPPGTAQPTSSAQDPANAAYVIFTSGSTGRPKGVVVSHRAVVASTRARFDVYPHTDVSYLMLAPLTIDAAVAGIYFSLAAGGRVVLPTAEQLIDPELLADLVVAQGVTHLDGLPSQYAVLLRFHARRLAGLRCVVLGGEALPAVLVRDHRAELPHVELFNEYGPTEGTVWATAHRCGPADEEAAFVPIGRAIPGTCAEVLTPALTPAAVGEVGEIYLSGRGLARAYVGQPARTAERFVARPDSDGPGERMYRTGDLAHVGPDGELVYHGRTDAMVKVRGFRVELGEIEACLHQHPELIDAAVVAHPGPAGARLVAIVMPGPGAVPGRRALAAFLGGRLPAYMVPVLWRQVAAMPSTAVGKVDRTLLTAEATTIGAALPA